MRTGVEIDGVFRVYDLTRVRWPDDLDPGERVIARNPDTGRLCLAEVSFDHGGRMWLTRVSDDIAPYRWLVRKRSVYNAVYKINE